MHRSSENVAAIATALAKAQIELSNPEKAMTWRGKLISDQSPPLQANPNPAPHPGFTKN